jgi:hypothetical protein
MLRNIGENADLLFRSSVSRVEVVEINQWEGKLATMHHSLRPVARIEQSPRRGRWLSILGWLAVAFAGAGASLAGSSLVPEGKQAALWIVAVLVLIVVGTWAVIRGRRHLTSVLPGLGALPPGERIVLFLRAFSDDAGFSKVPAFRSARSLLGYGPTPADVRTEEDQVARAVAPFGRMVALGSPSDRLPHVGADRSYASDEHWQSEVLAALDRANLVLLVARPGPSLAWEVEQVVRRNDPARLIILVTRDQHQYARFRESLGAFFPRGLPGYSKARIRILRRGHARAAIWFDNDWTPHLEVLRGGFPLIGFARRTQRALPRALRYVYQRAGVPLRLKPTVSRPRAVKFSVALVVAFWFGTGVCYAAPFGLAASAAGDSQPLVLLILQNYLPLLLIQLPVLGLWLYRVWRGGPVAITMIRVHGVFIGIGLLVVVVMTMAQATQSVLVSAVLLSALGLTWFLVLLVAVLLIGVLGLPAVTLLLVRQDVREWIDSRL